MKKLFYLLVFASLCNLTNAQTILYSEDFTGQNGKGVVGGSSLAFDTSGVSWTIEPVASGLTASSDWFQVQNEVFEGRDIDADQVWISDTIDISTFSNISLSLDASETGTMESLDFLNVEYSVDNGQNYFLIANYNGKGDATHTLIDDFSSESITESIPNGTSLIIRISMNNNSSSEYTKFDNVLVTGFSAGSLVASISSQTDVSCNGGNNGSLTATASNGTTPYTYVWSNGANTNVISSLIAGTYTVTLTDAAGSTVTASSTILEPSALSLSMTVDQNASCNGGTDGIISSSVSGGVTPYTYNWTNGTNSATNSNLFAGTYTLTVVDANGCDIVSNETISEPTAISLVTEGITDESCSLSNGSISVKANGGTGELTFDWSNGVQEIASANLVFQSFEGNAKDNWNYTVNPAAYNASGDVWNTVSSLSSISPNDQSNFWGMSDLENGNGGGAFYHTITFDPINVSGFNNAAVNFDFYTIGFDSSDEIEYEVVFDNDTVWNANGIALNKNTTAWTTVSTAIPNGTQFVRLRIQAKQNGSDYAGIDNVSISQSIDTSRSTISNLVSGSYTVTVTDENSCATTTSITVGSNPCNNLVSNLRTRFIQDTSATFAWDTIPGAVNYKLVIRPASSPTWTNRYFKSVQQGRLDLDNLTPNTKYFWSVMYKDKSGWSQLPKAETFITLSSSCDEVQNLRTTGIHSDKARLEWDSAANSQSYRVRYRRVGTSTWLRKGARNNKKFVWATGLMTNSTYEWQVKNVCTYGSSGTRWSPSVMFSTLPAVNQTPSLREKSGIESLVAENLSVFPNPTNRTISINGLNERSEIMLVDQIGRTVLRKLVEPNEVLNIETLDNGIYFLKILNQEETILKIIKH